MDVEIHPEPTDEERAAIVAALEDAGSHDCGSAAGEWWTAGLPDRPDAEDEDQ